MRKPLQQMMIAALLVGGCSWGPGEPPPPPPTDAPEQPPFPWISAEPDCRKEMRKGEWLVCENAALRTLHQKLAAQWERQRIDAHRPTIHMLQLQQRALTSERALCVDAACVENAYQRYLRQPAPAPSATPTAKPKPVASSRPIKARADPAGAPPFRGPPNRFPGERSCAAELGGSASAYLVRQCRVVNGNYHRACTADRNCADLRAQIDRGCERSRHAPGFCKSAEAEAR